MADGEKPPEGQQTPKELRDYADREKARADKAEAKIRELTFSGLGLDPSKGIGKAALTTYTGDVADVEALKAHLKTEYEWEPKAAEPPEPTGPTEGQRLGEQIAGVQERIQEAGSQPPPSGGGGQGASLDQQIAAAEDEGRVSDAMRLKTEKLLGIMAKG
jgi:hypothetical protein